MEAAATLRNNPRTNNNAGSPRKARYVIDLIRGMEIDKALNVLRFTNKGSASSVEQVLRSAIKNWEQKHGLDAADNNLYVKECFVDGGTTLRRFQPAPHGRAYRIRKRTNHITVIVASREKKETNQKDNNA